jgi:hypothetical protein
MTDASAIDDAVADTVAKVRDFLAPFDDVTLHDDGTCSLHYGSAQVIITVGIFDEDQAIVRVRADAVTGATPSAELDHHVARFQGEIGHLTLRDEADGTVTILFSHSLLGEFLNPAELRLTVVAVAHYADELDDDLAARFGGKVFGTA